MLPLTVELLTSMSGASPVTVTDSCTAEGANWRFTTAVCPSRSSMFREAVAKPLSSMVMRKAPVRTGKRNPPR